LSLVYLDAIEHLVEACPNIVQFHVRFSKSLNRIGTIQFLSTIKFQHLTWLTIAARDNVFDGSYLLEVTLLLEALKVFVQSFSNFVLNRSYKALQNWSDYTLKGTS